MIQKIQRYIGLLLGIGLLVVTFMPVRGHLSRNYYPAASTATILDRSAASDVFKLGGLNFEPWAAFTDYWNVCVPRWGQAIQDRRCEVFPTVFNPHFVDKYAASLGARGERLKTLLGQLRAVANVKPLRGDEVDRGRNGERRTDVSLRLEQQIATELMPWLEEQQKRMRLQSIIAHALLTLGGVLLIVFRRQVGAFVFPLHLLIKDSVRAGAAAKKLHDKV